ncbi:hypothetical protein D9758_006128 [Tetrapyrgos nigripes]|uniref:Uncharacterized protein n=1 Tax=Tetrapyrgos nigripes TaxID=182062 RepID=A0A8H5GAN3_9AGAR|nr:hypothetical protein D9758_006128 [Tetrapyrgos nigripes]
MADNSNTFPMAHFQTKLESNQVPWGQYLIDICRSPRPLGTVIFEEIEEKARENFNLKDYPGVFDFAGAQPTPAPSPQPCLAHAIPHQSCSLPSVFKDHFVQMELAPARGAGKLGVPFVRSTASSRSLGSVAKANEEFAQLSPSDDKKKGTLWNLGLLVDKSVPVSPSIISSCSDTASMTTKPKPMARVLAPRFFQSTGLSTSLLLSPSFPEPNQQVTPSYS